MSCSDLPIWYLRHRIAVLDVRSAPFRRAREEFLPSAYGADVCLRRLVKAGKIRRFRGGLRELELAGSWRVRVSR
jgi:hypothetical protein